MGRRRELVASPHTWVGAGETADQLLLDHSSGFTSGGLSHRLLPMPPVSQLCFLCPLTGSVARDWGLREEKGVSEGVDEMPAHWSCGEVVVPGRARLPGLGALLLGNRSLSLRTIDSLESRLESHAVGIPTCSDRSVLPVHLISTPPPHTPGHTHS